MISKYFGRAKKAKNNTGRSTKVTSIMISQKLKDRLSELKDAYECCYHETVTYDQMLTRWANNVGRFDPKVIPILEIMREKQKMEKEILTALPSPYPVDPTEGDVWDMQYSFERDGEEMPACIGDQSPFFAVVDGDYRSLLDNGWILMNDAGIELTEDQAKIISNKIKQHGSC